MTRGWMCNGLALLIAGAMALIAFSLARAVEGLGVMIVILASGAWIIYSAARQRRHERDEERRISGSPAQRSR